MTNRTAEQVGTFSILTPVNCVSASESKKLISELVLAPSSLPLELVLKLVYERLFGCTRVCGDLFCEKGPGCLT